MMQPTSAPASATGYGPGDPSGGGYGGPPPGGGGYGGPPGGGGYGGPPGGGYGPPPGGGYGPPPGGYGGGPPPGGFGGPPGFSPMAPQPPKGPNVGLIIGLGCLGLFVLLVVGGFFAMFALRRAAPPPSFVSSSGGGPAPTAIGPTPASDLKAELRDLRDFKGEFGKSRYFVAEIYNTGDAALGFPSAKVTLYDSANTAIDSGICASLVRVLPIGEKVPCFFSTLKADGFTSSKTEITPMKSYYNGQLANLKVEDIKFTPKSGYTPHQLEGKITNLSSFKAKTVWALVSLYGSDKKIVGADQALVAGTDLEAGKSGLFTAKIYNVAAAPQTYQVKAIGYSD